MSIHNNHEPTSYVNYEQTTPNLYLHNMYLPPPPPPEYYMHQRTGGEAAGGPRAGSVNVSVEERAVPPTGHTVPQTASIKAHPTAPILPRPYGQLGDSSLS